MSRSLLEGAQGYKGQGESRSKLLGGIFILETDFDLNSIIILFEITV